MVPVLPLANALAPRITLKESSASRASKVVPSVVQSATGGNLLAIGVLESRTTYGVAAEKSVWQQGYNQVAGARPDLIQAWQQRKATVQIPGFAGPEDAAQWATSHTLTVNSPVGQDLTPGSTQVPPAGPQGSATGKKWLVIGALLVGGGVVLYHAFKR